LKLYQWVWTTKNGILSQAGFRADADGNVICSKLAEGQSSSEEVKTWCAARACRRQTMAAAGFQRGQIFRLGLISSDGRQKAFVEDVPFPIEIEENGCWLAAKRLSEVADAWAIEGRGFTPREHVHWSIKGPGNAMEGEANLTEKGTLVLVIRPPKSGTLTGSATVKVEAASCRPTLRFKWGVSAIELPERPVRQANSTVRIRDGPIPRPNEPNLALPR
jgi:hypothetical protein